MLKKYQKIFSAVKILTYSLIGLGGGVYAYYTPDSIYRVLYCLGFNVQEIFVEGRRRASLEEIRKVLGVVRNHSIFDINLKKILDEIELNPWICSAVVERILPNKLYIRVCEKDPIAIWKGPKQTQYLIDKDGTVILPLGQKEYPIWKHMLCVIGEDAPAHVLDLQKALTLTQKIQNEVNYAVFLRSGRWDIYFKNGLCLKLPEGDVVFGFQRFLGLRSRIPMHVKVVDLRSADSILVEFERKSVSAQHNVREVREKK